MRRRIIYYGEPALRQKSKPVKEVDAQIRRLVADLIETMRAADGVGLAAPQVDILRRVIVAHDGECEPFGLINPRIVARRGRLEGVEGCLSIPGLQGMVPRARWVEVAALDIAGRTVRIEAEDLLARVLQHEIDHLNGVLFVDHTRDIWWLEEVDEGEDEETSVRRVPTDLAEVERHFAALRAERAEAAGS